MDIFLIFLWILLLKNVPTYCVLKIPEFPIKPFMQRRDHFTHTDRHTWTQKYVETDIYYKKGGPIFLLIGGRETINSIWLYNGDWIDYAKKFGAYCFYLEHRYYGESRPFNDTDIENLGYLTSEQAISDIGWFIYRMNEENKNIWFKPKWVTFGGSYSGTLSAWARMKYPHLIHAAVSTSGSLVAVPSYEEYYKEVEKILILENKECAREIKRATDTIEQILMDDEKTKQLVKQFNLCYPINRTDPLDKANLYSSLATNVGLIAQFNNVNKFFQFPNQPRITVKNICEVMTEKNTRAVERYARVNKNMLRLNGHSCLEARYSEMLKIYKEIYYDELINYRLWLYQTCTEFGSWPTSSSNTYIFGNFNDKYYYQICTDVFGKIYDESLVEFCTRKSNQQYGELATRQSRIVYIQGSKDPNHLLGVTQQKIMNTRSVFINGTAHCANIYPPSDKDPIQLLEARIKIGNILEAWLQESDSIQEN